MDAEEALLQLAGSSCHLVYIIYPDYSQDCFQPATDVSKETDPLLTEPNSQYTQTKPVKKSFLSSSLSDSVWKIWCWSFLFTNMLQIFFKFLTFILPSHCESQHLIHHSLLYPWHEFHIYTDMQSRTWRLQKYDKMRCIFGIWEFHSRSPDLWRPPSRSAARGQRAWLSCFNCRCSQATAVK